MSQFILSYMVLSKDLRNDITIRCYNFDGILHIVNVTFSLSSTSSDTGYDSSQRQQCAVKVRGIFQNFTSPQSRIFTESIFFSSLFSPTLFLQCVTITLLVLKVNTSTRTILVTICSEGYFKVYFSRWEINLKITLRKKVIKIVLVADS